MYRLFIHWWWSLHEVFWFLVCVFIYLDGLCLCKFWVFFFLLPYVFLFLVTFIYCQNKIIPTAASTCVAFSIVLRSPISFKYIPSVFLQGRQNLQRKQTSQSILSVQESTSKCLEVELTSLSSLQKILCLLRIFFNAVLIICDFSQFKIISLRGFSFQR